MPALFVGLKTPTIPTSSSGRLELAEWLTSRENPLPARVMANRVWYWLMGEGLVTSVDNFGTSGARLSHSELLDFLAHQFAADSWSVKKLIRTIVLSRAYRLAATHDETNFAADPDNALLWRHNHRRLDAEAIRDAMLAAAGALEVNPPAGSLIGRTGDGPIGGERKMAITEEAVAAADHDARSIYLSVARNVAPQVLAVFDYPDAAAVQGARQVTNVPSQALFLLNSEFMAKQSKRLAQRLLGEFPGNAAEMFDERFSRACWFALSRPPEPIEKQAARTLLARHADDPLAAWTSIARALLASAEFRYLD